MLLKKICLLGAFAVGKTSLVRRFVDSIFDEKYTTTIGVKVDKRQVDVDGTAVSLMLWDIAGEDEFQKVQLNYVRGAAGYLLVADGTRAVTIDQSRQIRERVATVIGDVPFVLIVNKEDLRDEWEVTEDMLQALRDDGWVVRTGSAKTGDGVEDAFADLAGRMVRG